MSAYNHLNDNELYALVRQDNEEAFSLLYERYWKPMIYKAMMKLNCDVDAEEVVQDTFIDIWKSRRRITIKHTFHTYIGAIVRYKVMLKMASNKKRVQNGIIEIEGLRIADNSTEQWLNFYDLRDEIELAIKALPEKCQLIFRMSRQEGLSDKQIAKDMNISLKTVEAHITRALKSLRASIHQIFSVFF